MTKLEIWEKIIVPLVGIGITIYFGITISRKLSTKQKIDERIIENTLDLHDNISKYSFLLGFQTYYHWLNFEEVEKLLEKNHYDPETTARELLRGCPANAIIFVHSSDTFFLEGIKLFDNLFFEKELKSIIHRFYLFNFIIDYDGHFAGPPHFDTKRDELYFLCSVKSKHPRNALDTWSKFKDSAHRVNDIDYYKLGYSAYIKPYEFVKAYVELVYYLNKFSEKQLHSSV